MELTKQARCRAMTLVDISEDCYLHLLRFLGAWWCLGSSLLEPYVLLVRPDEGIAQDYMAYQAANRDKLIQFVDKYVLPPMP